MPSSTKQPAKLGLIVGNRGFFPDHLAAEGRQDMLRVLTKAGVEVVALTTDESKFGAVETFEEAKRCADLFRKHRDTLDGVIVTLPNFGDERAIADTLRQFRTASPGSDSSHAGFAEQDDHPRPPRQLLRKNVGLQ